MPEIKNFKPSSNFSLFQSHFSFFKSIFMILATVNFELFNFLAPQY